MSYVSGGWTVDYRNFPYVGPDGYTSQEDTRIYQLCKFDSNAAYGVLFGVVGLTGQAFSVGTGASFTAVAPSPNAGQLVVIAGHGNLANRTQLTPAPPAPRPECRESAMTP